VYLFLNEIISAVQPLYNIILPKYIIDELTGQRDIQKIIMYIVAVVLGNWVFSLLQGYYSNESFRLRVSVAFDFTTELSQKLGLADYERIENPDYLDLKQKAEHFIYGDMHGFGYVLDSAVSIISKIVLFAGIIAIIATLNPFVLVFFILLVLVSAYVENWAEKKCVELYMNLSEIERRGMYLSDIFDSLRFAKEIRLGRLNDWLIRKLREHHNKANALYKQVSGYRNNSSITNATVFMVQNGTAYGYLVFQALNGFISIGSFYMYLSAVSSFTNAMRDVLSRLVAIRQFQPYYESAERYLNVKNSLRLGHKPITNTEHHIEFRNVSFRYSGQSIDALCAINLTIKPGEKIALVGENGSGKTTLIKLLTRLYDPVEGGIFLDGVDIREFDYEQYMSLYAVVFQDFALFAFSLKENVALAQTEETDDAVVYEKLEQSGLKQRLETLNQGIHTSVYKQFDGNGFEPSGGEAQKIALARALCKNAPVVILDEPTSALDPKAEYEMYLKFDELVEGKSALFISHRLSSCRFCDRIVVLQGGRIIETGTHTELLNANGVYANLYAMQARYYSNVE
jgi:ABC-type multidrug transport system fused ATPase/permease subunit